MVDVEHAQEVMGATALSQHLYKRRFQSRADRREGRMTRTILVLVIAAPTLLIGYATSARADDTHESPSLPKQEEDALIAKVRQGWHAQDGETADDILAKVAKVAHFVPRGWGAWQDKDGTKFAGIGWVKHESDTEDNTYSIDWAVNADGTLTIEEPYARTMALGWQAFALSTIQNEVSEVEPGANKLFLHNVRNLNFVQTDQGNLGDLLAKGKCALGDPVGVDYLDTWGRDNPQKGDFWRLQLSVNCKIPGPRYFTHDGVVLFKKTGTDPWRPFSFFAHRIATYRPGAWFSTPDPTEQEAFQLATASTRRQGVTWSQDEVDALVKFTELRNDGSIIHW
jgi:hypothetical protein